MIITVKYKVVLTKTNLQNYKTSLHIHNASVETHVNIYIDKAFHWFKKSYRL